MPSKRPESRPRLWIHVGILGGAYLVAFLLITLAIISIPAVRRFFSSGLPATQSDQKPSSELPMQFLPRKEINTARLFNGVTFRYRIETEQGGQATTERKIDEAYMAELVVRVRVPKAADTLEALHLVNPSLGKTLPDLERMLANGRVSNFFYGLYDLKVRMLKSSAEQLDALVSRHNFYDCDTILELEHPMTRRKVLLIQSEMDVVTDGTDPDRTSKTVGVTSTFQPFTSYRWARRTKNPSPFAEDRRGRIAKIDAEMANSSTTAARKKELKAQRDQLRTEISDLERFSFLVAYGDPFIVLPGFMYREKNHPFHPKLGDFAVVIYGGTLYPAIFGDTGPSYKMGEASLRICQEINPRSTPMSRPVSALEITYLVFPGSANPVPGPPDLDQWHRRCEQLLREIGGFNGRLHAWENLFKPSPTPTPQPSPTPSSSPLPALPSGYPSLPELPSASASESSQTISGTDKGVSSRDVISGGVPASKRVSPDQ